VSAPSSARIRTGRASRGSTAWSAFTTSAVTRGSGYLTAFWSSGTTPAPPTQPRMCTTFRTTYQRGSLIQAASRDGSSCARTAMASATIWRAMRVWHSDSVSVSQSTATGPSSLASATNSLRAAGP